ncbi:MAG: hypothetical protein AAGI63_09045 [Planctomycetota bacterium]
MNQSTETPADIDSSQSEDELNDGPGWLPAIMAATALMGIVGFITCGVSTWFLFQKRTDFAVRTLRGSYIGEIEQSLLDPQTKSAVVAEVKTLADDFERGKYEQWQSAEIMQGLLRLPVLQWGELQVIEVYLQESESPQRDDQYMQLTRLKRAVERSLITSLDVDEVLAPVRVDDPQAINGHTMVQTLTEEQVAEFVLRCKLLADRELIPEETFEEVQLDAIVRRAIERAAKP